MSKRKKVQTFTGDEMRLVLDGLVDQAIECTGEGQNVYATVARLCVEAAASGAKGLGPKGVLKAQKVKL